MIDEYKKCKMDLFSNERITNLLPSDGTVNYYSNLMARGKALQYFDTLLNNIEWKNDELIMFGKRIVTKRKVAWYGDSNFAYTYSNTTKQALPWTTALLELKQIAEQFSESTFNACLLNLYHNGNEGMTWHSDDEKTLVTDAAIASFSFGADRKFAFKHKTSKEAVSVLLESGSLLVMKDKTQTNWVHALPKATKINQPRINLTFRTMVAQ